MANLFGYGSTSTPTLVPNYKIWFDEEIGKWILNGKLERCTIKFTGLDQEELIRKWSETLLINKEGSTFLEPEF